MAINTQVVSEAMYGWYLLSRRGAEAGVMAKAAPVSTFYDVKQPPEEGKKVRRESDAISTDCGSEVSEEQWRPEDFGPPPGLENALDDAAPCLGNTLEELIWRGTKKDSSEIWWDWTEPLLGVSPMGAMQWTPSISLPLSSHLMGLLSSRRGKQRLRAVEQQSGAQLLLDEHWQAIHISGWPKSIGKAQELLDVMEGFVVEVSHAMWAELMRCRSEETATDDLPLTLSKLQELLGYRVHVERDALALRIFGPKHEALNAQKVLQRLEELCSSEILKLPDDCDWNEIKQLQKGINLTLRVEGEYLELEGLRFAVEKVKEVLLRMGLQEGEPQEVRKRCIRPDIPKPRGGQSKGQICYIQESALSKELCFA